MAQEDRTTGLVGFSGMKVPVRLATTANLTLSGEQTIDGVAAVTGDRVLVKDQTDQTENGIYVVDTGDWNRAADCDGPYDLVQGSVVYVNAGSTGTGFWYCTSANPVDIESDNITWARASSVLATVSTFWQTVLGLTSASTSRAAAALDASQLISSMTAVTSVDLGADYLGGYDASAAAERKMLVADAVPIRSVGGRLTLATGTPVMTTDQTAKTTVYFTPYNGDVIPIYDGTRMVPTVFTELSQATTDSTKSPAAVANNSNYDLFVWNDAGTLRCTRGPAWSSDTVRGTGAGTTELEMVKGVYLNKNAITNGPAANRGTYVGTVRSNGSSQIDWKLGSSAAGGGEAFLGVWNMYNRVTVATMVQDTTDSWTYQSGTWRSMNNSSTNRVSFVAGLSEDGFSARNSVLAQLTATSDQIVIAFGLNSTSALAANSNIGNCTSTASANSQPNAFYSGVMPLGFNYLQCIERCTATVNPVTVYGDASSPSNVMHTFTALLRM